MTESIKLIYGDQEFELPIVEGSEGEKAIEESVTFLRDYANSHFRTEEAFMHMFLDNFH